MNKTAMMAELIEQKWVRKGQDVWARDRAADTFVFKLVHTPRWVIDRIVSDHNCIIDSRTAQKEVLP